MQRSLIRKVGEEVFNELGVVLQMWELGVARRMIGYVTLLCPPLARFAHRATCCNLCVSNAFGGYTVLAAHYCRVNLSNP